MVPAFFVSLNNHVALSDYGRYHYLLLKFLSFSDCRLIVDSNCLLASAEYRDTKYGSYIHTDTVLQNRLSFAQHESVEYDFIISDNSNFDCSNKIIVNVIYDFMYMNDLSSFTRDIQMPQPMHPIHYYCKDLSSLLDSHYKFASLDERPIAIAFNGNRSKVYNNSFKYDELSISSRFDVVSQFDAHYSSLPSQNKFANEYFSTPSSVPLNKLFSYISKSKFFFCPPGYKNPFCHNLAEALHCGSIPVLAYSQLMAPPLAHLENCLIYKDQNLSNVFDVAFDESFSAYTFIKDNALDYYMNTMMPHSFFNNLTSLLLRYSDGINLYMPFFDFTIN